jgi:hypothetical protein
MVLWLGLVVAAPPQPAGRPLVYWGARSPIVTLPEGPRSPTDAHLEEVHAVRDGDFVVFRCSFDRPVQEATRLPGGEPVSGRLRAVLHLDADGDRGTGLDEGPAGLRTGADFRFDLGVIAVGSDPDESLPALALVTVELAALSASDRRTTVWRADDGREDRAVSVYGPFVEFRVPSALLGLKPKARLVATEGDRVAEGRLGF